MTYRECYEKGCLALQTAGIEEATLDARLLLEAVCGTNRNDLLVHGEQSVKAPSARSSATGSALVTQVLPTLTMTLRFRAMPTFMTRTG